MIHGGHALVHELAHLGGNFVHLPEVASQNRASRTLAQGREGVGPGRAPLGADLDGEPGEGRVVVDRERSKADDMRLAPGGDGEGGKRGESEESEASPAGFSGQDP